MGRQPFGLEGGVDFEDPFQDVLRRGFWGSVRVPRGFGGLLMVVIVVMRVVVLLGRRRWGPSFLSSWPRMAANGKTGDRVTLFIDEFSSGCFFLVDHR